MNACQFADLADRQEGSIDIGFRARARLVAQYELLLMHPEDRIQGNDISRQTDRVNLGLRQSDPSAFPRAVHLVQRNIQL